jgi:hypothetical protein
MVSQAHGKRSSRFSLLVVFAAVLSTSGFAWPVGLGTVLDKDKEKTVVAEKAAAGRKACDKASTSSRKHSKSAEKGLGFTSFSRWFL